MRGLALIPLLAVLGLPVAAQESESGGLEGLLERSLSSDAMQVEIEGLEGALSARAQIAKLTFSDPTGPWLVIEDAFLDWNRAALLRGRVSVNEIAAGRIEVLRLPAGQPEPEVPEAPSANAPGFQGFQLPELPVSIMIGELSAPEILLAEPVLGEEIRAEASGGFELADGDGFVNLTLRRTDVEGTAVLLGGGFTNSTRQLAIDLDAKVRGGGTISKLSGLPGEPPIEVRIAGSGELNDFLAEVQMRTNGVLRVGGDVWLLQDAIEDGQPTPPLRFRANLDGDLRGLLPPEVEDFVGASTELFLQGSVDAGTVALDRLEAEAQALQMTGSAVIEGAWPRSLDLDLVVAQPEQRPVQLPAAGSDGELQRAEVRIEFDADRASRFSLSAAIDQLRVAGNSVEALTLAMEGPLSLPQDGEPGGFAGRLDASTSGLALDDEGLADLVGDAPRFETNFDWQQNAPLAFDDFLMAAAIGQITGRVSIVDPSAGLDVDADIQVEVPDLRRAAAISGQSLEGRVSLDASGAANLLGGTFELTVDAGAEDLLTGQDIVDDLLGGLADVAGTFGRGTDGITVEGVSVETAELSFRADGGLSDAITELTASGRIRDLAVLSPELSGPLTFEASVAADDGPYDVDAQLAGQDELSLDATGTLSRNLQQVALKVIGDVDLALVAPFAPDIDPRGQVALSADVAADQVAQTANASVDLDGRDMTFADETLSALVGEALRVDAVFDVAPGTLRIETLSAQTAALTLDGAGELTDTSASLEGAARLSDLGILIPQLAGPLSVSGSLEGEGETFDLVAQVNGPSGIFANVNGDLAPDFMSGAVSAQAQADLGILSPFLDGTTPRGTLVIDADLSGDAAEGSFDAELRANGEELRVGIAPLDAVLGGSLQIDALVDRVDGVLTVETLTAETGQLSATASGTLSEAEAALETRAELKNLSLLIPQVPGPVALEASLTGRDGPFSLNADLSAPAGTTLTANGTVSPDFSTLDVAATGGTQLSLINGFIQPAAAEGQVSLDIGISGPPDINSVSGNVVLRNGRFADTALKLAIENLTADVGIASGNAVISAGGQSSAGGGFDVEGTLGFASGVSGSVSVRLNDFGYQDPSLVDTSVDGTIDFTLASGGGGAIDGDLALGRTEVILSTAAGGADGLVNGIRHVGENASSRQTRSRAGFVEEEERASSQSSAPFALNVAVDASEPIFIRGLGVDAEVGGDVVIGGTTNAIEPVGSFELVRGRANILTQRLDLTEGQVTLSGSAIPTVRFVATRSRSDLEVSAIIEGPLDDPDIRFESNPTLPEDEALAQLLFNANLENISGFQALQLANAVAVLRGGSGIGLLGNVREGLGVDNLDISTDDEGVTNVRVGRYINETTYTDFEVRSNGTTAITLNIDLTDSLTARGIAASDGSSGGGIFFERDY